MLRVPVSLPIDGLYRATGRSVLRLLAALACALEVAGCAVGPDFTPPAAPQVRLSLVGTKGQSPAYVEGLAIPQRWWELFHCPALNAVVARAIAANPDLAAARAALRMADANLAAARGGLFPQVEASAGASRQRPSAAQAGPAGSTTPYSVSSGQLSVSYALDVFGGGRRRVESAAAQAEAQYFEVEAAYLTLTSKIALAAITEASLRDQIRAAGTSVSVGRDVLQILKRQTDLSEATRVDVSAQDVALSQFEQSLQSLKKRLALGRNQLAAFGGGLAGEGLSEEFEFSCLRLPRELPLALPSQIVRNRPDVRAAEAHVHAATAEVGVALANRLPQFSITASGGVNAVAAALAASPAALFWSLAGSASQVLFDGMTLAEKQRAAEAGLDRAVALYRGTVVSAFQNVADVLQGMEADRKALRVTQRGLAAAKVNLDLTRKLLAQRLANSVQVLNAQQLFAQASAAHAEAKAALHGDVVMLFQALGGGWADATGANAEWTAHVSSEPERAARAQSSAAAMAQ
ncbi:MAG: efflux transporter outer membrane subunit [Hyphomicrobiales bacterium]|nr:MAG: efflux transporter outer membrane subunit [Hyphomicrobiales bacterium]